MMAPKIEIPTEFGGSWEAFCEDWGCPDGALAYSPGEISRGLSTLKRLWPERVAQIVGKPGRGTSCAASAIERGLLLAACEDVRYFAGMLARLKSGQRAAYSELVVVAALRRLGYDPEFEAPAGGSPDARCVVEGVPIFFEVYTPDQSYASGQKHELVRQIHTAVSLGVSKCRVEIGIFDSFGKDDIARAVEVIRSAVPATWTYVGDWARIRRIDQGQELLPSFDGHGSRIVFAGDTVTQGESTSAIVRWEESDTRAENALGAKRAQLSDGVANVVVIHVSAGGGGGGWAEVIAKFDGSDYDKIGAVAFFEQGSLGPPEGIRIHWRIVVNPEAQIPIPETLLSGLESHDESSYSNVPREPRLQLASR
jgi:hypothetical protein